MIVVCSRHTIIIEKNISLSRNSPCLTIAHLSLRKLGLRKFLNKNNKVNFAKIIFDNFFVYRVWWIIAVIISMFLCSSLIQDLWEKWKESPVIISLDHRLDSIGTIPFPAVTICPLSKLSINKFNYTDTYRSILKLDGEKSRNLSNEEYSILYCVIMSG